MKLKGVDSTLTADRSEWKNKMLWLVPRPHIIWKKVGEEKVINTKAGYQNHNLGQIKGFHSA